MVDQRVAPEKQNGVGTPCIPPMTRRLKCRIDPEQSPYTCMLPGAQAGAARARDDRPARGGGAEPKPAKIRAVSNEAAIG
jgi:hypothetical protein